MDKTLSKDQLVHIINPFWNPYGGSEQRAVNLFETLKSECKVHLWSPNDPHPELNRVVPIQRIVTNRLAYPRNGVLVIVGVYFQLGHWINMVRPSRTVLIYNTPDPQSLAKTLAILSKAGHRRIELVYASEDLRVATGLEGTLEISLIDLTKFSPSQTPTFRPFTIGRLSREEEFKHHPDDPTLYTRLAASGIRVNIMGPSTNVLTKLSDVPGVKLLRAGEIEAPDFLKSIDCFFYRTADSWFETWGRVVLEAMATGLPVVCGQRGGYQAVIQNGVNGFLFKEEKEAITLLRMLNEDRSLRRRIGEAARATAEAFLLQARLDVVKFYTEVKNTP